MTCARAIFGVGALAMAHAAIAHSIVDTRWQWSFDPWVVLPMAVSALLYTRGLIAMWGRVGCGRGVTRVQAASFAAGWLAVGAALVSPLDALASELFSAHMVQHELLMAVAAPLLVLGRPLAVWAWAIPARHRGWLSIAIHARGLRTAWRSLTSPLAAWLLHAVALWLWHVPAFFQAALASDGVHTFQHISFLLTGLLFWWNALGAASASARATAVFFLFTTMIHTGVLGALLTFAESAWYPAYAGATLAHGLDPLADQQLGGLIMWVPASASYLIAALWVAAKWLTPERAEGVVSAAARPSRPA